MKRFFTFFAATMALTASCATQKSICAFNDDDCDGVPDDLGRAYDKDGEPGPDPYDVDGDGKADGWAVDSNCDGDYDALGLDTTGDGFVDSIDINPGGEPDIISTGSSRAVFNCDGSGNPGDGDVTATGGTVGDGDGDQPSATWHAPVVQAAQSNLQNEFARWKNFFLKTDCGGGKLSVPMTDTRLVSEGMGYGMLIMANMGTQAEFDGMYATYRDAPKSSGGLMQWDCDACGTSCGPSNGQPASDADLDAAMALLQAEQRFGGGTYAAAAKSLIGQIRAAVLTNCAGVVHLVAGEWDPNCQALNPSYFSPGYYRVFAQVDTLGAGAWNQAIDSAYQAFEATKTGGPQGLWPDGMGSNCFSCNGYDACRVPWRLATDFAWTGEPRAASLLAEVSGKVDAQGMDPFSGGPNSAFYGSLALSGLAVGQEKADQHYNTWINANPLYDNAYYQGTLRMIYLLLAGGNFPSTLAQ